MNKIADQNLGGRERRSYFRMDDNVSLAVRKLEPEQLEKVIENFQEKRNAFSYINTIICLKEEFLPQRRFIETKHPEIAAYFGYFEQKLEALARLLIAQDEKIDNSTTEKINLSGKGARITVDDHFHQGDMVELKLQIYPSMARIYVIGEVVWACELNDNSDNKVTEIAIDFKYIDPVDCEVIVKHLHDKQMENLSRNSRFN